MTDKELLERLQEAEEEEIKRVNALTEETALKTIAAHKESIEEQMSILRAHMDSGSMISREMMKRWNDLIERKNALEARIAPSDAEREDLDERNEKFLGKGWGKLSAFLKHCVDYIKDADGYREAHKEQKAIQKEEKAKATHRAAIKDQLLDNRDELTIAKKDLEKAKIKMEHADRRSSDYANAKTAVFTMLHNMFHKDKKDMEFKTPEEAHDDRGRAALRVQRLIQKIETLEKEHAVLERELERYRGDDAKTSPDKDQNKGKNWKEPRREEQDETHGKSSDKANDPGRIETDPGTTAKSDPKDNSETQHPKGKAEQNTAQKQERENQAQRLLKSELFIYSVRSAIMEHGLPDPGATATYQVQSGRGSMVNVDIVCSDKDGKAQIMYKDIDITKEIEQHKPLIEVTKKNGVTMEDFSKYMNKYDPNSKNQNLQTPEQDGPDTVAAQGQSAPVSAQPQIPVQGQATEPAQNPTKAANGVGTRNTPAAEPKAESAHEKPARRSAKDYLNDSINKKLGNRKAQSRNSNLFGEDWRKEARDAMRNNDGPAMPER